MSDRFCVDEEFKLTALKHFTFYDLIVTKARGKSGPLFRFDVHDDVRLINNARVEKEDSHPGKIVERRWYERNKHIFPASRWEVVRIVLLAPLVAAYDYLQLCSTTRMSPMRSIRSMGERFGECVGAGSWADGSFLVRGRVAFLHK